MVRTSQPRRARMLAPTGGVVALAVRHLLVPCMKPCRLDPLLSITTGFYL